MAMLSQGLCPRPRPPSCCAVRPHICHFSTDFLYTMWEAEIKQALQLPAKIRALLSLPEQQQGPSHQALTKGKAGRGTSSEEAGLQGMEDPSAWASVQGGCWVVVQPQNTHLPHAGVQPQLLHRALSHTLARYHQATARNEDGSPNPQGH